MGGRIICFLIVLHICALFCSGSRMIKREAAESFKAQANEVQMNNSSPISSVQRDVTTPLPTVPTVTPATLSPIIIPNSNPDSSSPAAAMNPTTTPSTTISSGASWCVASQSASEKTLQGALDYACSHGGDCSVILPGGSCYYPITLRDHASYAFNSYYQRNPVPNSCNFGGTAVLTSTDPSTGTCQYPSTSTSSSVLNTTNSSGFAVYGSGPAGPSGSSAARFSTTSHMYILTCLPIFLA